MQTATETYKLPESFTLEKQERMFDEIIRLYDLADEVMAAVAMEDITNREIQLELAKPFATQITNSANILSAFYIEVVRNGRPITPDLQDTLEMAFRNIFHAFRDFLDDAEEKLSPQEII